MSALGYLNRKLDRLDRHRYPLGTQDALPSDVPDRGYGVQPGKFGYDGRGRGRMSCPQVPRMWRGNTSQVCGLWPFSVGAGAPLVGAPLGRHVVSGVMVCGDPVSWFQRAGFLTAPTGFLLGREGFGKSSLIRRMATGCAYFGVLPLVLGDLKPDYPELIGLLGGEVIPLGRGRGYINPLDMSLVRGAVKLLDENEGNLDDQDRARLRAEFSSDARGKRHTMVSAIVVLQRNRTLEDVEDSVLAAALRELEEHFVDRDPVLSDLVQLLQAAPDRVREAAYDRGDVDRYHELTEGLVRTLQGLLQEGRIGEMFSRSTSRHMTLDAPAAFDVSSIPEDQTDLVAAALTTCWGLGLGAVQTRVALGEAGILPKRHYLVILDELWRVLLAAKSGMVDRVNSLTRLNRQVGTGLVMVSHTIKDLQSLPDSHDNLKALGLIERAGMLMCGALPPEEWGYLRRVRDFSDAELRMITSWQDPPPWSSTADAEPPGKGRFLIKVGGRPGIPLRVDFTATEQRLKVHDTSHLWR